MKQFHILVVLLVLLASGCQVQPPPDRIGGPTATATVPPFAPTVTDTSVPAVTTASLNPTAARTPTSQLPGLPLRWYPLQPLHLKSGWLTWKTGRSPFEIYPGSSRVWPKDSTSRSGLVRPIKLSPSNATGWRQRRDRYRVEKLRPFRQSAPARLLGRIYRRKSSRRLVGSAQARRGAGTDFLPFT